MGTAVIIGAGEGLSASLARKLAQRGHKLVLAARNTDKLADLVAETGAVAVTCNASDPADMEAVFAAADKLGEPLDIAIYNPSARVRGSIVDIDPTTVKDAILITAYGGFLMGQQAAKRMLPNGKGSILFTGASAGVKGYPMSSTFAMGKFALRGLAQSMARELAPKNIHVAHIVIDGGIKSERYPGSPDVPDQTLDPDAIADSYVFLSQQQRSAWTWEIELRPWVENF